MNILLTLTRSARARRSAPRAAGFTLIEMIVVIVIIGILAALAGPAWITFLNQRRVTAANDAVLAALQQAQSEAKRTKRNYSVSFRTQNNIPQIAVHPAERPNTSNPAINDFDPTLPANTAPGTDLSRAWVEGDLAKQLGLKPKQVVIQSNLDANNSRDTAQPVNALATLTEVPNGTTAMQITFDQDGVLAEINGVPPDTPLAIVAGLPRDPDATPLQPSQRSQRCVVVQTLLGGLAIGKNFAECEALLGQTVP